MALVKRYIKKKPRLKGLNAEELTEIATSEVKEKPHRFKNHPANDQVYSLLESHGIEAGPYAVSAYVLYDLYYKFCKKKGIRTYFPIVVFFGFDQYLERETILGARARKFLLNNIITFKINKSMVVDDVEHRTLIEKYRASFNNKDRQKRLTAKKDKENEEARKAKEEAGGQFKSSKGAKSSKRAFGRGLFTLPISRRVRVVR